MQKIDHFVQERLVGARGDRANAEVQEQVYRDLEVLLNELSDDVDLSSSLTGFFNAIDEVLKDPGNVATRNLAVGKGIALTENISNLHSRVFSIQRAAERARDRRCRRDQQPGRGNSAAEHPDRVDRRRRHVGERGGRLAREAPERRSIGCRSWSASTSTSSRAAA